MLIRLLIRRGSVLEAKLHMAKRLGKARAIIVNSLRINYALKRGDVTARALLSLLAMRSLALRIDPL